MQKSVLIHGILWSQLTTIITAGKHTIDDDDGGGGGGGDD